MRTFKDILIEEEEVSVGIGKGHVQVNFEEYKTLPDDTDHIHSLDVNSDGDGKTLGTNGDSEAHIHKIKKWVILEVNDHTHQIDK